MKPFVGRDQELQRLEDLSQSDRASLAVIKGRRRIGKSRLAEEFCGFVSKHPDWSLKTGKPGKLTLYRLSDNYLRFYVYYIETNLTKIEQGLFLEVPLSSLPGWESKILLLIIPMCKKPRAATRDAKSTI